MQLAGKVAIVTGGGSGIGAATAKRFAEEGAHVAVADLDLAAAESVAAQLEGEAMAIRTDVRLDADAHALAALVSETFGRIDVLVNNAGRGLIGNVLTTEESDWDDLISVNLKSVYLCSRHVIPAMRSAAGGSIINIASNVAHVGIRDRAAYVASKGGVAALTRAMALDHIGDGIRVNAIAPGVIWSSYYEAMLASVADPAEFKRGLESRAPVNRMGTPDEVASLALWLASDAASFAVGAIFTLDGGMTAW